MKRIWFQFVRREAEAERPPAAAPQHNAVAAVPVRVPVAEAAAPLRLRMAGELWSIPSGEYRPVLLTGRLHEGGEGAEAVRLFPAGLNLDIGELRRLDGHVTAVRDDVYDVQEADLPLRARIRRRTALAAVQVGRLITGPDELREDEGAPGEPPYARGTALLRIVHLAGAVLGEPFRCRIVELDQVQLIQDQSGWQGRLRQVQADEVRGPAGRAVLSQLRAAVNTADPLGALRRAVERYARAGQGTVGSRQERDDETGQKV